MPEPTAEFMLNVSANTTWREAFDAFTPSERDCIRDAVDAETLEPALEYRLTTFGGTEEWENSIFLCLATGTARTLFLSIFSAQVEEEGLRLSEEERACLRDWVDGMEVEILASDPDEDPVAAEAMVGMIACIPNTLVSVLMTGISGDTGENLSEEEVACLRESVTGFDWAASFGGDDSDIGAEFTWALLRCSPQLIVYFMAAELGTELPEITEEQKACLKEWATNVDRDAVDGDESAAGLEILAGVLSCVPDLDLLEVQPEQPIPPEGGDDDHGNSSEEATSVAVGGVAQGAVDYEGDVDFFVIEAEDGQFYQIDVSPGTLADPYLELRDSEGFILVSNDDHGDSLASRIVWSAPAAGDYYLVVGSYGAGSYTLTVAYSDIVDDHGNYTDDATTAAMGEDFEGALDYESDKDFFVFEAEGGKLYRIDVTLGTLTDSEVNLYGPDGEWQAGNDDYGDSLASRIHWEAPIRGEYYIAVGGYGAGTYTFVVAVSDVVDDHTNYHIEDWLKAGSTLVQEYVLLTVGESEPGALEYDGDVDFLVFEAEGGVIYQIDVALGTLTDSLVTLYGSDGEWLAENDDYGDSLASRILWEAPSSGSYYVSVGGFYGGTGSYTLTVAVSEAVPTPTAETESPIPVPGNGGDIGTFTSVSAGDEHTCGVKTDGAVVCWGEEFSGRTMPPAGSFKSVSAGWGHTCGVKTDGSVACWGYDGDGQSSPPDGPFVTVSAGENHNCGVKADGGVACWGVNDDGESTPPGGSFVSVSAGVWYTCGVKTDGTAVCWGNDSLGKSTPPGGTFASVDAGFHHTCGVKTDGTVACWGHSADGRTTPPGGAFNSVSVGDDHTCGVKADGWVVCWGDNEYGQSWNPIGSFASVSAGENHTCGLKTEGTVECWGYNEFEKATPPGEPAPATATGRSAGSAGSFSSVSVGDDHTCGVKTDSSVVCWGDNLFDQSTPPGGPFVSVSSSFAHTCGVKTDGSVACWGFDGDGQSSPPDGPFVSVSAGQNHTCGVKADGEVACWGVNDDGESAPPGGSFDSVSAGIWYTCGVTTDGMAVCWGNDSLGKSTPPGGSFAFVDAGFHHTCGVKTDGTVACWGFDGGGRTMPPGGAFDSISVGDNHTCGVKTDGSVVCWGDNEFGQSWNPIGSFASVSAGVNHTCGVKADGSVVCWGYNDYGKATPPS